MADMSRRPGRPRDTSIDERALAAARELLAEQGFEATTIQAVAVRSGVHASAIYRRWSSRIELIEDAAFPMESPLRVDPTGDLREDLRRFIRAYTSTFSDPATRAAAGPLLAYRRSDAGYGAAYQRVSVRPQFFAILESAPPAPSIRLSIRTTCSTCSSARCGRASSCRSRTPDPTRSSGRWR